MKKYAPQVGDVLLLEHSVEGIPVSGMVYVLVEVSDGHGVVAIARADSAGLYANHLTYTIGRDVLDEAFTETGKKARLEK
jgi:hypothetical protein